MAQPDRPIKRRLTYTSRAPGFNPRTLFTLGLLFSVHYNYCSAVDDSSRIGGGGVSTGLASSVYALLIIDVQNCFTSTGTLPVPQGEDVIPVINDIRVRYRSNFKFVAITQDWHCSDHVSFASQHRGHDLFERINLTYVKSTGELCRSDVTGTTNSYAVNCSGSSETMVTVSQVLWPDHCVQGTEDAKIHPSLNIDRADILIQKGFRCQIDSYSAFYDNGRINFTNLHKDLTDRGVTDVFIVGLATDFCVFYSAMDAKGLGYKTWVILDATRGITKAGTETAVREMMNNNIRVVSSDDLDVIFNKSSGQRLALSSSSTFLICMYCWFILNLT